jgi:hypothetical protein
MRNRLFNTKVRIESKIMTLSPKHVWISEYVFWRELWASISLKCISSRSTLYIFAVRWKGDFPGSFRVKVNGQIFVPTQPAVLDPQTESILFHAKPVR